MKKILLALVLTLLASSLNVFGQVDRKLVREPSAASQNTKRLALVIGNGRYVKVSPLDNPVNDATDMAVTLQGLGFEVIKGTDANLVQMRRLIREFGEKLEAQKGVGLFYYAGHGVEVRGKNFLVPVDADIAREVETEDYAIDVNSILRQMDAANNGFNVVILDACRNNPFSRGWNRSGDTGGLANVNAPTGTYIAFAAAPGFTASDGKGTRNGVFTGSLVKQLRRPGLKLEEIFKATREEVMTLTGNKQVPWDSSSVKGDFYFKRGTAISSAEPSAQPAKPKTESAGEKAAWALVNNSKNPEDLRLFISEIPNGVNTETARNRLEELVWASVSSSNDRTKLEAYLQEFPDGVNSVAAKIRLRQTETTATESDGGRITGIGTSSGTSALYAASGERKYAYGLLTFRDGKLSYKSLGNKKYPANPAEGFEIPCNGLTSVKYNLGWFEFKFNDGRDKMSILADENDVISFQWLASLQKTCSFPISKPIVPYLDSKINRAANIYNVKHLHYARWTGAQYEFADKTLTYKEVWRAKGSDPSPDHAFQVGCSQIGLDKNGEVTWPTGERTDIYADDNPDRRKAFFDMIRKECGLAPRVP